MHAQPSLCLRRAHKLPIGQSRSPGQAPHQCGRKREHLPKNTSNHQRRDKQKEKGSANMSSQTSVIREDILEEVVL